MMLSYLVRMRHSFYLLLLFNETMLIEKRNNIRRYRSFEQICISNVTGCIKSCLILWY